MLTVYSRLAERSRNGIVAISHNTFCTIEPPRWVRSLAEWENIPPSLWIASTGKTYTPGRISSPTATKVSLTAVTGYDVHAVTIQRPYVSKHRTIWLCCCLSPDHMKGLKGPKLKRKLKFRSACFATVRLSLYSQLQSRSDMSLLKTLWKGKMLTLFCVILCFQPHSQALLLLCYQRTPAEQPQIRLLGGVHCKSQLSLSVMAQEINISLIS